MMVTRRSVIVRSLGVLAGLALALTPGVSSAQTAHVRRFVELTAADVAHLDRAHTVVIVPGAIIEEHGPYLPVYADGYRNDRLARDLANGIVRARPGWSAVILPTIPLGAGAFNIVAGRPAFPGSVGVRASTVRDVFMDVADALGAQGFRYVLVVHGHGDPNHNRALDLAGDYFHDTYGGVMVHLLGRAGCQPESMGPNSGPPAALFDSAAAAADADSPHAGAVESARTMYLRPDLVPARIKRAPDVTAPSPADWRRAGADSAWPGYVGAPRHASVALGRWEYTHERTACTDLAVRLIDGLDERTVPRYADRMRAIPPLRATLDSILAMDDSAAARQAAWLRRAPARP